MISSSHDKRVWSGPICMVGDEEDTPISPGVGLSAVRRVAQGQSGRVAMAWPRPSRTAENSSYLLYFPLRHLHQFLVDTPSLPS